MNSQPYYASKKKLLSSRQIFRYAVPARTVTKKHCVYDNIETHGPLSVSSLVSGRPGPQDFWAYWRTARSTVIIPADQCLDSEV